jgi:nucleotide-binding universal stress UspA family protein
MIAITVSSREALLAAATAAVIVLLLLWRLRARRPVSEEVAKARRSLDSARLLLVPTTGTAYAERGVELACRLAKEQAGEILLVYVIEVPRTLPLKALMPQPERKAEEVLHRAKEIVALHHLPARTLIFRGRDSGNAIVAAAKEHRADLIVLGIGPHRHVGALWGRTLETLLHRAPCEVVFDKLPT